MGKQIKNLMPLIGIVLLIYIILTTGIDKIISSFQGLKWSYILIAILFFIPILFLQTLKWALILKKQKTKLNFFYLIQLQIISIYYGLITPGKLGSLIKISYIQKKTNNSFGQSSSSVIADRLLDLITLFIFALIGTLLLTKYISNILSQVLIPTTILFIIIFIFISKKRSKSILLFTHKFLVPQKLKDKAKESFHSFYDNFPKIKTLIIPFLLTFLVWILIYTQLYIVALSLNIIVPFFYFIFISAISTVVTLIPITIDGLGTRELTLITLFKIFNIPAEKIVSMSLSWIIFSIILFAVLGIYFAFKNEIRTTEQTN